MRNFRQAGAVAAAASLLAGAAVPAASAAPVAASAASAGVPKLLVSEGGAFKVRPRRVVVQAVQCCGIEKGQDLLFGTAVIRWSKWNGRQAVGAGVLNAGFYTPPRHDRIRVVASRPRHGRFTRFVITYLHPRDRLVLMLVGSQWKD